MRRPLLSFAWVRVSLMVSTPMHSGTGSLLAMLLQFSLPGLVCLSAILVSVACEATGAGKMAHQVNSGASATVIIAANDE